MTSRVGSIVAVLFVAVLFISTVQAAPTLISQELQPVLAEANASDMIPVVVLMKQRHNVNELSAMVQGFRADDRKALMWSEVSSRADQSQGALLDHLYELEQSGTVERIRSLKLANAVAFHGTPGAVKSLSNRDDILEINFSQAQKVIDDPVETPNLIDELDEIVIGIDIVNAPDVWNLGYTGEGVLLAIIDTGVNYNHHDLADHMWDGGGSYPYHGYDFYNGDNNPYDDNGHGTHCAGTALGDGTAGSQTGVAPDATLMALKVFSSWGGGVESDTWDALDFCLEHGVDVTSLSAGWFSASTTIKRTFREQYDLLNAAGIVSIAAAGNEGAYQSWYPIPDNVRTPGTVPPPWLHPDQSEPGSVGGVITAGATENNDTIAYFSSRGPVTWDNVSPFYDFDYTPGDGLYKPDICAPGVNVKSLNYSSNTGYRSDYSGTSMATPHIAGAAALLLSMDPTLTPAEICEALEMTAVELGATGKDNTFGSGRIDCFDASQYIGGGGDDLTVTITPSITPPYYIPQGGGNMVFDVLIENNYGSNTAGVVWVEVILPNSNTYHVNTYNVTYRPGIDIWVEDFSQHVPGYAPAGTYTYFIKAGLTYPNDLASDSFEFIKLGSSTDSAGETWATKGFEQLVTEDEVSWQSLPSEFGLSKAYPNPFNPTTSITLALPYAEQVQMSVFNGLGQEVAKLQDGRLSAGQHTFTFDASDLSSGVYFVSAQAGTKTMMQKIVLMK